MKFLVAGGLTLFLMVSCVACGGSKSNVSSGNVKVNEKALPPNASVYKKPMATVWQELLEILKYEYLYEIIVLDDDNYRFSTDFVREDQPGRSVRHRLSGFLTFDGAGVVVVLYNQIQVSSGGPWKSRPSDYLMEQRVLTRLRKRLKSL